MKDFGLFPRFLKVMAKYHDDDICRYFKDVFGYEGNAADSAGKMTDLFAEFGVDMYFEGEVSQAQIREIDIETSLSPDEIAGMLEECLR